jgi:circadian clock protein KaiC
MALQRLSTGITRLDALLQGGYIKGRTYLVTGDSGTGKTIACLQFLVRGLKEGEKAVYVTVDERPAEILESAASLSWDLQSHIQEKNLVILDASPYFGARSASGTEKGIDPQKIVADLGNYARRLGATLLIIDPITPLILPNDATSPSQDQARSLIQLLQSQLNTTNLFTAQGRQAHDAETAIEQFLASGVLVLKSGNINGKFRRTMIIRKMRGTAVEPAEYAFTLASKEGIELVDNCTEKGYAPDSPMFESFELAKKQP